VSVRSVPTVTALSVPSVTAPVTSVRAMVPVRVSVRSVRTVTALSARSVTVPVTSVRAMVPVRVSVPSGPSASVPATTARVRSVRVAPSGPGRTGAPAPTVPAATTRVVPPSVRRGATTATVATTVRRGPTGRSVSRSGATTPRVRPGVARSVVVLVGHHVPTPAEPAVVLTARRVPSAVTVPTVVTVPSVTARSAVTTVPVAPTAVRSGRPEPTAAGTPGRPVRPVPASRTA
jgi:hypothetical protein